MPAHGLEVRTCQVLSSLKIAGGQVSIMDLFSFFESCAAVNTRGKSTQ
jgi:hypothetical protein